MESARSRPPSDPHERTSVNDERESWLIVRETVQKRDPLELRKGAPRVDLVEDGGKSPERAVEMGPFLSARVSAPKWCALLGAFTMFCVRDKVRHTNAPLCTRAKEV